ncbi:MAG: heme exporter protein CcmD [Proteobacteria bacterium]|nr:heme exporter protein CcmD [Pseudomonadota bacterium]
MNLLHDIFAGGHASFVAAAFACAIVLIGAELLLLGGRARKTKEPHP